MSKRETPMTRRYWERVRGTLLEEYLIVRSNPGVGRRMIDAVVIEDGDHRIASQGESVSLDGHDIVVEFPYTGNKLHPTQKPVTFRCGA